MKRAHYGHGTWIDPEEYAYFSGISRSRRKFRAISRATGKPIAGIAGVADTYFSIPAIIKVKGKRGKGFLYLHDLDGETTIMFSEVSYAKRTNPRTSKCEDCGHTHGPGYCAEVCKQCIEEERGEYESTRNPPSGEARRFISSKIRKLAHEGYRGAQRIAVAYAMARRKGLRANPMDLMSHGGGYAVIDLGKSDMPFRYTVQLLEEGRPLQVPPGVRILVKGMTRQGARALADHLNKQHKRNPAFLRKGRRRRFFQVRRKNPTLAVMGANPPDAAGDDIEATWAEINYRRPDDPEGDNIVREHEFPDGFVATPLKDGGVLLRHPRGLNLWTRR